MASTSETPQDAVTEKEITDTAVPASSRTNRNACTILYLQTFQELKSNTALVMELMSHTPKKFALDVNGPKSKKRLPLIFTGREGLGAYIEDPTSFPPTQVIYHNNNFVAINDMYPKSSVHTLLLPRGPQSKLHPFDAFEDPEFLTSVQEETKKLCTIVAKEIQRKYGKFSKQDQAREGALNGEDNDLEADLPQGRDWEREVMAGVHAHPSMAHLHVHVMSVDRFSECLKHRKHYNSFATAFFVPIEDFPLREDDVRRHPGREGYLNSDFKCWKCGKNFGNKFSKLKTHLAEEFEVWKRE